MGNFLKNIVKAGVTMALVGILLATAAPLIADGLAGAGLLTATQAAQFGSTSVAWTGAFFGAFGMLQTAVAPIIGKVFEPKKGAVLLTQPAATSHTMDISPALPQPSQTVAHNISSTHFQDMLLAQANSPRGPHIG